MELDTLYKRTKTGDIQYWKVLAEDGVIHKESGRLGTINPVRHQETCSGKNIGRSNETSPMEQAELQAKSDWKGKRDEGYKSLQDLGIKAEAGLGYVGIASGKEVRGTLMELLEQALAQFNTDASGNAKPMLAPTKSWAPSPKNKYPKLAERKLDGVRTFLIINSMEDMFFLSRSGKPYETLGHLVEIFKKIFKPEDYNLTFPIILDGEIYKHGWTLEEISQAVKKYRPGTTEKLEFWMYDIPTLLDGQKVRSNKVFEIVGGLRNTQIANPQIIQVILRSDEEVKNFHDLVVEEDFEGIMLKDPFGLYEYGQRSRYWTKVKMFDETEFKIKDFVLGQRGVEDLMFVCESPGGDFEAKMKGSKQSKQTLYDEVVVPKKHIGKMLTVKHFGYTAYNKPYIPIGKAIREEGT